MDLRANTAVDVLIGPFVDVGDGNTTEDALTLTQAEIKLSKNGQTLTQKNESTSATFDDDGYYNCQLDATDTNTEGNLVLSVHQSANALPVRHEYNVLSEAAWDSLYAAKDTGVMDVNVSTVGGQTVSASGTITFPAATLASTTGAVGSVTGAVGSVTAAVTLPTIPSDWITAAGIADNAFSAEHFAASSLDGKGDWPSAADIYTNGTYSGARVYIDGANGVSGTTIGIGTDSNPHDGADMTEVATLAAAANTGSVFVQPGSSITMTAGFTNFVVDGDNYSVALGSSITMTGAVIRNATIASGTTPVGTGVTFQLCTIGTTDLPNGVSANGCTLDGTASVTTDNTAALEWTDIYGSGGTIDFNSVAVASLDLHMIGGEITLHDVADATVVNIYGHGKVTVTESSSGLGDGFVMTLYGAIEVVDSTQGLDTAPTYVGGGGDATAANQTTILTRLGTPVGADFSADIADIPTVAEFNSRTLAAAAYFDPAADTVANVTTVATCTTNTDMRGTNNAALASVCTEARLTALDSGDMPSDVVEILSRLGTPTDFGSGTVSIAGNLQDLADNGTATFDRSTDSLQALRDHIAAGANLTAVPWNAAWDAEVESEVTDALNAFTLTLPGKEAPPLSPTFAQALGWLYKALRNRKSQTATLWALYADDESTVDAEATVSDDGTTAIKQEIVQGS